MTTRGRSALALVLLLSAAHLGISVGWVARIPAPEFTFHDHDLALVLHPKVLRGEHWAPALPVAELVPPSWPGLGPYDLFEGALRNGDDGLRSYKTAVPIHYLAASVPAVIGGVSLVTVRAGPVVVLWLLLLAALDTGRVLSKTPRSDGLVGGVLAAVAVSTVPVSWMGVLVGVPTLGNMAGVGLALWALVRSDGLSRLGWAALAGVLIGLSTRWGESVGDSLACLAALAGPLAASVAIAAGRLLTRRALRGILGAALAGAAAWWVLDIPWLSYHFETYVLDEARLTAPDLSALLPRVWANLDAYRRALTWSLLGLGGVTAAALGAIGLLYRSRRQPLALVVLASPLSGLLALAISAKGHDYYAAPVVPALMIAAGAGTAALPGRAIGAACGGWLVVSWLFSAHLDLQPLSTVQCTPAARWLLAGDPSRCVEDLQGQEELVYPWFRRWRRPPDREVTARRAIGAWLTHGEGRAWLDGLPPGALVLLQVPPGPGGGADVVHLIGQSERPDVIFQQLSLGPPRRNARDLLTWAREEGHTVEVATFGAQMHTRDDPPERPSPWMRPRVEGPRSPHVATWRLP